MIREGIDDLRRMLRDKEVNNQKYKRLTPLGVVQLASKDIKVGDLIIVEKVGLESIQFLWFFSLQHFTTKKLSLYILDNDNGNNVNVNGNNYNNGINNDNENGSDDSIL